MNKILNIVYKKLAVLQLPTFMRLPFVFYILEAAVTPLQSLLAEFKAMRAANIYKIKMNGQVCHLRGMLNDNFDITERRIKVDDGMVSDWLMVCQESTFNANDNGSVLWINKASTIISNILGNKTYRNNDAVLVSKQGDVGSAGYDFVIKLPKELQFNIDENRLKSLVNYYRLASKRYALIYN